MSHGKIRTEKICLNCGTETTGRFCPNCGQENIEPKQSVWHLVTHFFSDITHFDGKFFSTVKDLFTKPGFLSKEYMIGRRASYLDPIRMYIFTSAFFFIVFFSFVNTNKMPVRSDVRSLYDPELLTQLAEAKTSRDSLEILTEYNKVANSFIKSNTDSSRKLEHKRFFNNYPSIESYDSIQKALPFEKKDGWLKKRVIIRILMIEQRFDRERGEFIRELFTNFIHNFPKMLFISLPVFALLLKLLYVRRRQFYYVDHGIFAIHLYIFSFLILLIYFLFTKIQTETGWKWLGWLTAPLVIYPFIYYYKAMRRFYVQGRAKTVMKYLLLFMLSSIVLLIIFICGAIFTVIET
ncbi:MAG TPA: DUF3667 domain-containing protein [Puia sp.]